MHHRIIAASALLGLTLLGAWLFSRADSGNARQCTYSTYQWNVRDKKPIAQHTISKPTNELTSAERDSQTGCTVCEEDQVTLSFPGLPPFKVCKRIAPRVEKIITELQRKHAPLHDVVGYRVGMTRGEIDNAGNRTGYSNHSFGVALDINTGQNGLYENCLRFSPACRLIKGGPWDPQQQGSLTEESAIVQEFKRNGFHWGGEIAGQQKDFMHFSPSGY